MTPTACEGRGAGVGCGRGTAGRRAALPAVLQAGRSKIRHRVRHGCADPWDERRDLWRSFLEVVTIAKPSAVVMENVPDMALDREMFILRTMVHELEMPRLRGRGARR